MNDTKSFRSVLDKGFVELTNIAGPVRRADAEFDADIVDIARAARVSFGNEAASRSRESDIRLNKRLHKDNHTSPFEMIDIWLNVKLPIFVQREWTRHRTWRYTHVNEISRRYVASPVEFYMPGALNWRKQCDKNKQGSAGLLDPISSAIANVWHQAHTSAFSEMYRLILEFRTAREMARMDMPVSAYTRMAVKMDLLTLRHFLTLRQAPDAQLEIREYANAIHSLMCDNLPGYSEVFGETTA